MGLNPAAIKPGHSGGLGLHRSFLAPGCVLRKKAAANCGLLAEQTDPLQAATSRDAMP